MKTILITIVYFFTYVFSVESQTLPPTVEIPAAANYYAAHTYVDLSVLGADDSGEQNLTYTWSVVGTPPAPVTFNINGTNEAKNTSANLQKHGTYTFLVTIKDPTNQTVTSEATVTVERLKDDCESIIDILPHSVTIPVNGKVQFYNVNVDQFGDKDTTTNPTGEEGYHDLYFYWWATGQKEFSERINLNTGIYTAPNTAGKDTVLIRFYNDGEYACSTEVYSIINIINNDSSNIIPTVSITKPANNQTFAGPATIRLRAAASDADGSVSKVEFYNGSALLHTETDSPYTYTWLDVPVGTYAITAKATDNLGIVSTSEVANITVAQNIAPTISITNPANGENFTTGATVSLLAAAADPDGSIDKVEFYNGDVLLGIQYFSPYTFKWFNAPEGSYTITAKAIDNLGLSATSAPVTITVSDVSIVSNRPYSKNEKTASNGALSVRAFPNPATHIINLQIGGLQPNKPATLSLISNAGIVLQNINISNAAQTTQLDVSTLAKGVYTLKIVSGEKVTYKQFVKL